MYETLLIALKWFFGSAIVLLGVLLMLTLIVVMVRFLIAVITEP
jgi:hypothetical protein